MSLRHNQAGQVPPLTVGFSLSPDLEWWRAFKLTPSFPVCSEASKIFAKG
jgi:hypothetical protein